MRAGNAAIILSLVVLFSSAARSQNSAPQGTPSPNVGRIRLSPAVEQAQLVQQVAPVYPEIAKTAKVSGTVVLHAIIDKDGRVQDLTYVSGPELLSKAALDAVKQWRYKPTLLSGQPVEVETTVSVQFDLNDTGAGGLHQAPPTDPQFHDDVMALINVTNSRGDAAKGAAAVFDANRPQMEAVFPDTPNKEKIVNEYRDKLVAITQSGEFLDNIVAVYAKYLSDDDIKGIIQFYQTPAGKRFSAIENDLNRDLSQAGIALGREKVPGILEDLCKDYPELQGKARFCPAPQSAPDSPPKQ